METPEEIARRLVRCLCPVIPPLGGEHAPYCIIPSITLALSAERERATKAERERDEALQHLGLLGSMLTNRALMASVIQKRLYRSSQFVRGQPACREAGQLVAETVAQLVEDREYLEAVREAHERLKEQQ